MRNVFKTFNSGRAVFYLMIFICVVIAVVVLKFASSVILPLTIAVLLAFVMYPLIKALDKIRCPRVVSIILIVVIIVFGLYIFGVVLFTSGRVIVAQLPNYESRFMEIYSEIARLFELPNDEALSVWQNLWDQQGIRAFIRGFTFSFSNHVLHFISSAFFVVLFMVFILLEASHFREKLETAFEGRAARINRMGNDLITQVTRYLAAKFFISLANGVIFAVAFELVGLEFAIVWGVFQFVMNFIPAIGSIVTGVVISLFAIVQFWPEPGPIILVIAIILGVNIILGSALDPKIVGERVGISPLMILISLTMWSYIWGFAGMILAVPMTVIIRIICDNIPILEPVSILMGSRRSVQAKKAEMERTEE